MYLRSLCNNACTLPRLGGKEDIIEVEEQFEHENGIYIILQHCCVR